MIQFKHKLWYISTLFLLCSLAYSFDTDQPCAARQIAGKSVICVCNATYCDTITRVNPSCGTYVAYTSSEEGLRFDKTYGNLKKNYQPLKSAPILELNLEVLYQEISGFGGAVTDSAGINWRSLDDSRARQNLVDSYFSKKGIEYSMIRVPIGGTDFSIRPYTYDDQSVGDTRLENFALAPEDYELKIPLIKAAMEVATKPIRTVASLWSPPAWMKTTNNITSGYLKEEYYQTLADYFLKFLESYDKFGIPVWGITTTNEPLNSVYTSTLNRLQWTVEDMATWIADNLGPTIRNSTYKHVKIIAGDDQRPMIPLLFNLAIEYASAALEYIDGVGVHFYLDQYTPATQLTEPLEDYPEKFIIYTEASQGTTASSDERVELGSWSRAESYAFNIVEDLNHKVIGWLDWNMCLNETGGPNWLNSSIDSAIIVSSQNQEFYKQPMFYAIGHFSKFVPRGSKRVNVEETSHFASVPNVAFLTPEQTIVVIVLNMEGDREVVIKLGEESAAVLLEEKSLTTIEFPLSENCLINT